MTLNPISTGNALQDGRQSSPAGWFVGHFIDNDALRRTKDVEIKWGIHTTGATNGSFSTNQTARTMSVLIRGRFRLTFLDGEKARDVLLEKEGDYVLWGSGIPHNWKAEEDSVVLTVRWPSVMTDQVDTV